MAIKNLEKRITVYVYNGKQHKIGCKFSAGINQSCFTEVNKVKLIYTSYTAGPLKSRLFDIDTLSNIILGTSKIDKLAGNHATELSTAALGLGGLLYDKIRMK